MTRRVEKFFDATSIVRLPPIGIADAG